MAREGCATDGCAVQRLAKAAYSESPGAARSYLERIRDALPALAEADSVEAEQSVVRAIGEGCGIRKDSFGPLVRDLLHYTPEQREMIVNAALAQSKPSTRAADELAKAATRVLTAVAGLDEKTKAAFIVLYALVWGYDNCGIDIGDEVLTLCEEGSLEPLRQDVAWEELLGAYDRIQTIKEYKKRSFRGDSE